MSQVKLDRARFLSFAALAFWATSAGAHELWIEAEATGSAGREQVVHVCWGHAGDKETGQSLQRQQDKLTAQMLRPDGRSETLDLAEGTDSFTTKIVPAGPGYHVLAAELQTGIIDRPLHDIPASTRIVMYGKSFIHVEGGEQGLDVPLGMDLEIVSIGRLRDPRPGDVVTVKVLLKGKPLGGREAIVSLGTPGSEPFAEQPSIQSRQWTIEGHADPRSGEVSFPLIASGPHVFCIRYFDESPGRYDGDLNHSSEFSHLQKGDTYERTMYVSTFKINVKGRLSATPSTTDRPWRGDERGVGRG